MLAYVDYFLIYIIDQPVSNDPQALVSPHTDKVFYLREAVGCGETHTMVDSRQISQIEDVVEFGWCWWKIIYNWARQKKEFFNNIKFPSNGTIHQNKV